MSKIEQGRYEISTTKADAINKFKQMEGYCRQKISGDNAISFYCTKKGRIVITKPQSRNVSDENSTTLFADIVEMDGRTYLDYYTEYDKTYNIFNFIIIIISIIFIAFSIIFFVDKPNDIYYIYIGCGALITLGYELFICFNQKKYSPNDSKKLIEALEERINAVNNWEK